MSDDDHELVERWQRGDQTAGAELFSRYFDLVYRFFRNKVDGDIDDLVQSTFLACLESRHRFQRSAPFRPMLAGIARNTLLMAFRSDRRRFERNRKKANEPGPSRLTPSGVAAAREEQRVLLVALRKLSLDHQTVVELHYWEQMGTPEIAVALGIAEGTAKSRLHHARKQLQREIKRVAGSEALAEVTVRDLQRWAESLRRAMGPEGYDEQPQAPNRSAP